MADEIKKDLLINVYGYEDVKRELALVRSWLTDEELLNNPKLMIPKGILFYGPAGNGKTLMLREYAQSFNAPVYLIDGKDENASSEIISTFKKAKANKFSIVCIDEIDLLIDRSSRTTRTLQQELDGINTRGSILVLATTNSKYDVPGPLLRPGRLDKHIEIDCPDQKSRKDILLKFLNDLEVPTDNINLDHVAKICSGASGAVIKAICNDAYLRCKSNITTEEIERSFSRVAKGDFNNRSVEFKDRRVAVHEAGHALMTLHFNKNWSFYKATFNESGGTTDIVPVNERDDSIAKREESVMIALAGYLSEEIFFRKHDVGSFSDYCKAQDMVERLVERVCMKGINHLAGQTWHDYSYKHFSDREINKTDNLICKMMRKYASKAKRWLKKHKAQINELTEIMMEKGEVSYKEASLITGI